MVVPIEYNPVLSGDKVLFNDLLGTTLGSAATGGKAFDAIQRTAFGETKNKDNSYDDFFTGKPYVGELGYAFMFRNYRADKGKWSTADPLGYPDGFNNIAYVNNGVMNAIDPLGGELLYVDIEAVDAPYEALYNKTTYSTHSINSDGYLCTVWRYEVFMTQKYKCQLVEKTAKNEILEWIDQGAATYSATAGPAAGTVNLVMKVVGRANPVVSIVLTGIEITSALAGAASYIRNSVTTTNDRYYYNTINPEYIYEEKIGQRIRYEYIHSYCVPKEY